MDYNLRLCKSQRAPALRGALSRACACLNVVIGCRICHHTKLWRMKYRYAGKERLITLGVCRYGDDEKKVHVSLIKAREKRDEAKALLRDGKDPMQQRRIARQATVDQSSRTLRAACERFHAGISGQFKNEKHRAQWLSSLESHIRPTLGDRPVSDIVATGLGGEDRSQRIADARDHDGMTSREQGAQCFLHVKLSRTTRLMGAATIYSKWEDGCERKASRFEAQAGEQRNRLIDCSFNVAYIAQPLVSG